MNDREYKGVDDTVNNIIFLIKKHSGDDILKYFDNKSLKDIFDFISKDVRYLSDPMNVKFLEGGNIELLRSPEKTMYELAGDCDDKSILSGALFERFKIPYRISVMSNKKNKRFHHVYPEVNINGNWKTFDPTYDTNIMFQEKPFTRKRTYYPINNQIIQEEIK